MIRLASMGVRFALRSAWNAEATAEVVYQFDQSRVVIGRASTSDIWLPHAAVGRQHLTVQVKDVGYVVIDEGSTNGTFINGVRIPPQRPKRIKSGDIIEAGGFQIQVEVGVPTARSTSCIETGKLARNLYRALTTDSEPPAASLLAVQGPDEGHSWQLPPPPARVLMGRDPECDIRLGDDDTSRRHLELTCDFRGHHVRDLSSKNGVKVNGRTFEERWIEHGDEVSVGATTLQFSDPIGEAMHDVELGQDTVAQPPAELSATGEVGAHTPDEAHPDELTHTGMKPISHIPARASSNSPSRTRSGSSPVPTADAIIFVLAGFVLALSLVALLFLLKS